MILVSFSISLLDESSRKTLNEIKEIQGRKIEKNDVLKRIIESLIHIINSQL
jgi:hypothetical protein